MTRSRRSVRGACSAQGRQTRRRMAAADPRFPRQRRDPQFRQRQGRGALQPGRRRSRRTITIRIKNCAADRAGARRPASSTDFKRAATRAAASVFIANYKAYFARHNARVGGTRTMLDPQPRVVLVPGLGLFGLGRSRPRMRASPPISPRPRSHASPTPRRSAASSRSPRTTCSTSNIGRSEQAKLGQEPESCRWRVRSQRHRRGRRDRRRDRQGLCGGRRRGRAARCRSGGGRSKAAADRRQAALAVACDVTNAASVRAAFDQVVRGVRRRRHRRVERRRGVAGPHRRGRRSDVAQELRAEFLRPPARRAGRGEDHAGAGHRRLPAVQCVEAGGEPGPEFRALRAAQGGDAVPCAAIRGRLRRRRHPLQRRQCRPHPLGPAHRRFHQGAFARRAACPSRTI